MRRRATGSAGVSGEAWPSTASITREFLVEEDDFLVILVVKRGTRRNASVVVLARGSRTPAPFIVLN